MDESEMIDVEVFTAAVQLPDDARSVYLQQACGGDHALRQRVEALLNAHSVAPEFLEQRPPGAGTRFTGAGERAGDWVGRYKLLQQIGEGGCGVVFMAEQAEPVHRKVALKLVKPGMDTKTVITRFEAERQALAMMDHPNIAGVLDAGVTANGRPYFVMELIRGIKITDYCDQASATIEERLELFIQICDAVQHAHHKGIIHRDLKPSNLLVAGLPDGRPLPKVIDFGIAKATNGQRLADKTLFTEFELLIGTPAYMSPEQAALASVDVDTRSDIYSLGVLLYELLTGTTPFDTRELLESGIDEVRRVVCHVEPARPSTRVSALAADKLTSMSTSRQVTPPKLIRQLRGDLDWIVMKAMEKDRARRYSTANALAMDVRRYLEGEAIIARPPSTLYKLQRTVRRHKLAFAGLVAMLVLLVACLIVTGKLLQSQRQMQREFEVVRAESAGSFAQFGTHWSEAGDAYRTALRLQIKYFGPDNPRAAALQSAAVGTLVFANRRAEAESLLEEIHISPKYGWPQRADWLKWHADTLARAGHWPEALEETALAVKSNPIPAQFHLFATLLVQNNDTNGYRKMCVEIITRFSGATNPFDMDKVAKDCLILPASGVDLAVVSKLAQSAIAHGKNSGGYTFLMCTRALADYRLGHFQEVVDEMPAILKNPFPYTQAEASATLAMAQFKLNHINEARAALDHCAKVAEKQLPPAGSPDLTNDWPDWIIAHALLQEGKSLIEGKTSSAGNHT
ncbi:MAG TPA: serine/threonine-protein kinase [Verrucomicrobiae bacterium]|jgi:serine/threonine protein kinase